MTCALHFFKREHLFQRGAFGLDGHDLLEQLLVADEAVLRLAVVEDVLVILFRHRRVDGDVDGTHLHDGVVHDVPLAPVVVADQCHLLFGLQPHGNQSARHVVHFVDKLRGRIGYAVAVIGHGHHHVLRLVGQLVTRKIKKASGVLHGREFRAQSCIERSCLGSKIHTATRTITLGFHQGFEGLKARNRIVCRRLHRRRDLRLRMTGKLGCWCQRRWFWPALPRRCQWVQR